MSYTKQTWVNESDGGDFDINADHLNHIEDGIEAVDGRVAAVETSVASKADASAVSIALGNKADASTVTALTTTVGTKADQTALDAAVSAVPEQARDAVGAALVQGANITITVDDAGNTITVAASGGGSASSPVVRQYASGAWPVRGVPTTTPVIWDGPDTSPPPIDATHAYDGADTLDTWLRRATS